MLLNGLWTGQKKDVVTRILATCKVGATAQAWGTAQWRFRKGTSLKTQMPESHLSPTEGSSQHCPTLGPPPPVPQASEHKDTGNSPSPLPGRLPFLLHTPRTLPATLLCRVGGGGQTSEYSPHAYKSRFWAPWSPGGDVCPAKGCGPQAPG